jgi:hypothetical protein
MGERGFFTADDRGRFTLRLAYVNFSSVADPEDQYDKLVMLDGADEAIVADAVLPELA